MPRPDATVTNHQVSIQQRQGGQEAASGQPVRRIVESLRPGAEDTDWRSRNEVHVVIKDGLVPDFILPYHRSGMISTDLA